MVIHWRICNSKILPSICIKHSSNRRFNNLNWNATTRAYVTWFLKENDELYFRALFWVWSQNIWRLTQKQRKMILFAFLPCLFVLSPVVFLYSSLFQQCFWTTFANLFLCFIYCCSRYVWPVLNITGHKPTCEILLLNH